ncbi:MAG: MarR family transcriptional regulator [Armatimonadetes bacterium]|nr:MarR family transcriptional regulator [Armatimonadota bacterium]
MAYRYTNRQGQYLAFIYLYTRLNRRPPAEADIQAYFGVSAPAVHQMIVSLEKNGLISRVPRQARSIRVLAPPDMLPALGESAPSPGQAGSFEARYPNIADWIAQGGWIELSSPSE